VPEETIFGANMTTLNFALTRTAAREWRAGDEIVTTQLDHDGNVAPWLELARDRDLKVQIVWIHDDTRLDLDDLESKLSERTRVVAFPIASNAVGTVTDVKRIVELAHSVGALAWADAVHYGPHGPIDVGDWGVDVLICSPYKYFGPHLGLAFGRAELLDSWRPYKVRPAPSEPIGHRFETGTLPHELLAGFVAAVEYVESVGWDAIRSHERELGERFLAGLPDGVTLYGLPTMDGRVATFAFNVDGVSAIAAANRLGDAGYAVWHGNYYALEVMDRLGVEDEGAVRAGIGDSQQGRRSRRPPRRNRRALSPAELLQRLIRFDTTNPPGNEAECMEFIRSQLAEAGIESELYAKDPDRPNLVARIEGGDKPPLLLQGHVDVVTTSGQDWSRPPFGGELVDGYVWGRGAVDMKGPVAMLVSAFLRAKQEDVELPGDVILAVLADEENGGDLGARFLAEEHAHLFDGVRYALSEFGGFSLELGGRRFYPVQVAEKQICWLTATIRGRGGHGAVIHRGGTNAPVP